MKAISIAGNVGKDAEIRTTQSGDRVTSWSVAVEERAGKGGEKRTFWFDVSLWGARGEALAPYVKKGARVSVTGELSTREHEGRTYFTIRAWDVALQGGGDGQRPAQSAPARTDHGLDDEIPF